MAAEHEGVMEPLQVTAHMRGFVESSHPIHLDSLLAASVARRRGMPERIATAGDIETIEIPLQLEPGGRFHMASAAHAGRVLASRLEHIHKRAPHEWYTVLCGDGVKRVNMGEEPDKSWRVPRHGYLYDRLTWWCAGDADAIRDLLRGVIHVGARRRHGIGRVARLEVEPCESWDGFPVVRDGKPLRNLPLDYPGLGERVPQRVLRLTFPYYLGDGKEMLACPT